MCVGVLSTGDIKPRNIMRLEDKLVLIDLDATAYIGTGYSGAKVSSAFVPPELIYLVEMGNPRIKTFEEDEKTGEPITTGLSYNLVRASHAHDAWSLGEP